MPARPAPERTAREPGAAGRSLVPRRPRRAGPERFDDAIVVTRTRAWIALLACLGLLAAVVVWAATATVNRTVTGSGVLLINGTITQARSPAAGTLVSWQVNPGQQVTSAQVMGWVQTPSRRRVPLRAPIRGKVLDLEVGPGASVTPGQVLASLSAVRGPVGVYTFLPPHSAQLVRPGMRGSVAFPGGRTVSGKVTLVGTLPLTRQQIEVAIGSRALADEVAPNGAVTVAVTPSHLPARQAQSEAGHVAPVTVIVGSDHPLGYIF